MHILITGGSGFLGARLARELLRRGALSLAGGPAAPIETLTLADRVQPPADLLADPRVRAVTGDLLELAAARALPAAGTDAVFHLAAAVSAECEADFDLGMRSNFAATHALLEACRALGSRPLLVFASSVAVFGRQPGRALPEPITDDTLPTPQGSYGVQKFIGEQLVADYARKGFVRGRSARLMTVSVRPGRPNGAASGFLSGMIREPLAGQRARVPVSADTAVALSSPARAVEGLLRAAEATDAQWGPPTAINLPSLRTTVGEMAAALERVAGPAATALLDWAPDAAVQGLVGSWPAQLQWERARALGLAADDSFEQVVRAYARENAPAVRLPLRD
ncbi:D-erythronate dehydrogenase [Ramlibacter sp.]|uniref:D-erythronate dehydrogenase n=1 Tax=Ramlibacter sp. TaxID=1917967 RepID=UPI002FC6E551